MASLGPEHSILDVTCSRRVQTSLHSRCAASVVIGVAFDLLKQFKPCVLQPRTFGASQTVLPSHRQNPLEPKPSSVTLWTRILTSLVTIGALLLSWLPYTKKFLQGVLLRVTSFDGPKLLAYL
eukprot:330049-Amphidinium_carterae.1